MSSTDPFIHQRLRTFGELISDSFIYFRRYFKSLSTVILIIAFPLYFVQIFLLQDYNQALLEMLMTGNEAEAIAQIFSLKYASSIGLNLMSLATLASISLRHIYLTYHDEPLSLENFLQPLARHIFSLLTLYLLIGVIFMMSAFFFLLPGIYLGIMLSLASVVIVIEEKNIFEAIQTSWNFIKGYWWYTLILFVLIYIISLFAGYLIGLPLTILSSFFTSEATSLVKDLLEIAGTAISSLLFVIVHIAFAMHYFSLKELHSAEE